MTKNSVKITLISMLGMLALFACSSEAEVVTEVVEVEKQVVVEKEVIKEVQVPGETVVTEVVKEGKVPGETVIVEKEVEVEKKEKELVIYSGRSESLVGPIIEEFSVLTGIPVEVKYGKTGEMVSLLETEGSKTPADVFYAQDPGGLGAVADMLDPMSREVCDLIPAWAVAPRDAADQCSWIGITGRARVLVYNPDVLSEADLPTSMEDLTDPKWKGKLGWAPTNGSFQAMITGMRIYWGEEKTEAWLDGIMANEPIVYPKNTPQVQAAADQEIQLCMVNHYYLHRFIAKEGENFKARNHYLNNGDAGSVVLVSGAGILDASDNKGNAVRFMTFMTSCASSSSASRSCCSASPPRGTSGAFIFGWTGNVLHWSIYRRCRIFNILDYDPSGCHFWCVLT